MRHKVKKGDIILFKDCQYFNEGFKKDYKNTVVRVIKTSGSLNNLYIDILFNDPISLQERGFALGEDEYEILTGLKRKWFDKRINKGGNAYFISDYPKIHNKEVFKQLNIKV